METIYDDGFYCKRHEQTFYSASQILQIVLNQLPTINTAVDIGCGVGTWLSVLQKKGIIAKGWDGSWVPIQYLVIKKSDFLCTSLDEDLKDRQSVLWKSPFVDFLLTLEVAEHIPKELSGDFIDLITSHADYVLFSAAIPGQTGDGHINEQWPSYWAKLFYEKNFFMVDTIRSLVWEDDDIPFWYRQNCFLVVRKGCMPNIRFDAGILDGKFDIVHPELFKFSRTLSTDCSLRTIFHLIKKRFLK